MARTPDLQTLARTARDLLVPIAGAAVDVRPDPMVRVSRASEEFGLTVLRITELLDSGVIRGEQRPDGVYVSRFSLLAWIAAEANPVGFP